MPTRSESPSTRPAGRTGVVRTAGPAAAILFIDDEEMIRRLGRLVLERAGFEVLAAEDGTDGVEIFTRERDRIGLVVLDVMMPRMGGQEAFHRIMELDPAARILIST